MKKDYILNSGQFLTSWQNKLWYWVGFKPPLPPPVKCQSWYPMRFYSRLFTHILNGCQDTCLFTTSLLSSKAYGLMCYTSYRREWNLKTLWVHRSNRGWDQLAEAKETQSPGGPLRNDFHFSCFKKEYGQFWCFGEVLK